MSRLRRPPRGVPTVVALLLTGTALVAGWFATGHASAPDSGLLQVDVLSLHERVPGVVPVDGLPSMYVVTCPGAPDHARELAPRYGLVVSRDADLARRLALPRATSCYPGYALVDREGFVRYRSYDPGWQDHAQEQQILLDALDGTHHGGLLGLFS